MTVYQLLEHSVYVEDVLQMHDICIANNDQYLSYVIYFTYTLLIERAIHNSMCSNATCDVR